MKDAEGRLSLWKLRFSVFNNEVVQRAGVKHQAAYALSSLQKAGTDMKRIDDEIPLFLFAEEGDRGHRCSYCDLEALLFVFPRLSSVAQEENPPKTAKLIKEQSKAD